jgi:hypothetical protein
MEMMKVHCGNPTDRPPPKDPLPQALAYCYSVYELGRKVLGDKMSDNNHTLEETLKERGAQYGPWDRHAATAQQLMHIVDLGLTAQRLSHSQRETLHMICHKIGRIVNGNCNHTDSWVDIAGYAQLIVKQLEKKEDGQN